MKKFSMLPYVCLILSVPFIFSCTAPRKWTKTEKALAIGFVAAHTVNAYTTERHQDHPDRFYEINPILGKHPSDERIIGYFSITGAGALIAAHFLPKWRKAILIGYGGMNVYWSIHDHKEIRK